MTFLLESSRQPSQSQTWWTNCCFWEWLGQLSSTGLPTWTVMIIIINLISGSNYYNNSAGLFRLESKITRLLRLFTFVFFQALLLLGTADLFIGPMTLHKRLLLQLLFHSLDQSYVFINEGKVALSLSKDCRSRLHPLFHMLQLLFSFSTHFVYLSIVSLNLLDYARLAR